MDRTMTPTKGNATIAISVSTHSRVTMTARSARIVPTWRIAMTSTWEKRRASRFTSFITRDISSAEWRSEKNCSGISWM